MSEGYPGVGRVLVTIPTSNEAENLRHVTDRVRYAVPEADVLVADDNSPDGTGNIAGADSKINVMRDATGGYRAYRMTALDTMDVDTVASQGYWFQVDLAWRARRNGFRVAEVPITFAERERGKSTTSPSIVREAPWRVTAWGTRAGLRDTGGVAVAEAGR